VKLIVKFKKLWIIRWQTSNQKAPCGAFYFATGAFLGARGFGGALGLASAFGAAAFF
jgi:hypothetical protein